MTNEELLARFMEMDAKMNKLEEENKALKARGEETSRGMAGGLQATADSVHGNLGGMVAARSVTIATRPVLEHPELYPSATFAQLRAPEGQLRGEG